MPRLSTMRVWMPRSRVTAVRRQVCVLWVTALCASSALAQPAEPTPAPAPAPAVPEAAPPAADTGPPSSVDSAGGAAGSQATAPVASEPPAGAAASAPAAEPGGAPAGAAPSDAAERAEPRAAAPAPAPVDAAGQPPSTPVPPAPASNEVAAPEPPAALTAPAAPCPEQYDVYLGAGLALGVLNLPNLGAGPKVYAQLAPEGFWPVELSAVYFFENVRELDNAELDLVLHPMLLVPYPPEGARAKFQIAQLSVALCPYERGLTAGSLFVCGGLYGGMLAVETEGFGLLDGSEQQLLFGLEAYVRWRFRLGPGFGLTYSVGLDAPLTQERFGYEDRFGRFVELFQASPVGGRVDLALTAGF